MKGKLLLILCFIPVVGFSQLKPQLQIGHDGLVDSVSFDTSGRMLHTIDEKGRRLIWDFFGQKEIASAEKGQQLPVSFIPASGSGNLQLRLNQKSNKLYVLKNERTLLVIPSELYRFNRTAASIDGRFIAYSTVNDKYVFIRDMQHPDSYTELPLPVVPTAFSFHPQLTNLIAIGTVSGNFFVYDVVRHELVFELTSSLSSTVKVAASADGKVSVTQSEEAFWFNNFDRFTFDYHPIPEARGNRDLTATPERDALYWKNYHVRSGNDSGSKDLYKQQALLINNKVLFPLQIVPYLIDIKSVFTLLVNSPYIVFEKSFAPQVARIDSSIYFTANHAVMRVEENRKTRFVAYGDGNIRFAVNRRYIASFREPFYLTVTSQANGSKTVYHVPKVSNLAFLGDSDTLVVEQEGKEISLLEAGKSKSFQRMNDAQYAGQFGNRIFVRRGDHLYALGTEQRLAPLRTDLKLLAVSESPASIKPGMILYYTHGVIDVLDSAGSKLATLYQYRNGQYLIFTPDNYFFLSSRSLLNQIQLKDAGGKTYSLGQLEQTYFRPHLVLQQLGIRDTARIGLYKLAYEQALRRNGNIAANSGADFTVPTATIVNWGNEYVTDDTIKTCQMHFESPKGSFLSSTNVLVNGVPLWPDNGIRLRIGQSVFDTIVQLPLSNGNNYVSLRCTDDKGRLNQQSTWFIKNTRNTDGKVYFLGIAANRYHDKSHDLRFARHDVSSLAQMIRDRWKKNCVVDTLMDEQVNQSSINSALERLRSAGPNDLVIISYSGHGLLDDSFALQLGTFNIDFTKPAAEGYAYSSLEQQLQHIPARKKLVFIDACNSGGINREGRTTGVASSASTDTVGSGFKGVVLGPDRKRYNSDEAFYLMQEMFTDFREENGSVILTAARGTQFALEGSAWEGHGVFTYCITRALQNKEADRDGDGSITIAELKRYLATVVPARSNGHQTPVFRKDNPAFDWVVW